jgi:integrase
MARTKKHPGNLEQRSPGVWRVRLCVGTKVNPAGRRVGDYHSYTVHGTKLDAQNYATNKLAELTHDAEREAEGLPGTPTFSALLDAFERDEMPLLKPGGRKSYGDSLKILRHYFVDLKGDPRADKIGKRHVKRFNLWRRTYRHGGKPGEGVSDHTVARDFRVLRRIFNFAAEMEFLETANPCAKLQPPKADEKNYVILTDEQVDAMLNAARDYPMLRMYLLLLAETGARAFSEALQLEWSDVDLTEGDIHIKSAPTRRTKTGRSRWVPMTESLHLAMRDHAAAFRLANRSPYVFHHTHTTRRAKAGERVKTFRAAIERVCRDANIPKGWRIHDLRHRRVTTWIAEGRSPALIQEVLGHSTFATTDGYKHLARKHLRALVQPIEKLRTERTG